MPNGMGQAIKPKTDQLNSDDLLTGPITIRITGVKVNPVGEQRVSVSFEDDDGKPYKPCKSMCRVMVSAWGADSAKYVGRAMTLFCDPKVKWGGMEVGGIRISHMTDIEGPMTMALTMTKGNKKPFVVKPLTQPDWKRREVAAASQPTQSPTELAETQPAPASEAGRASEHTLVNPDMVMSLEDAAKVGGINPQSFFIRLTQKFGYPVKGWMHIRESDYKRAMAGIQAVVDANQQKNASPH